MYLEHFRRPRFAIPYFRRDVAIEFRFMGDEQDAALVRFERALELFLSVDVQMVRRFIEHEQVRFAVDQLAQAEPWLSRRR